MLTAIDNDKLYLLHDNILYWGELGIIAMQSDSPWALVHVTSTASLIRLCNSSRLHQFLPASFPLSYHAYKLKLWVTCTCWRILAPTFTGANLIISENNCKMEVFTSLSFWYLFKAARGYGL